MKSTAIYMYLTIESIINVQKLYICVRGKYMYQQVGWYFLIREWAGIGRRVGMVSNRNIGKPLAILMWNILPESINLLYSRKINREKFDSVNSSSFFFLKLNSKTIQHIRVICTPNDCSTSEVILFLATAACELRSMSYGSKHVA